MILTRNEHPASWHTKQVIAGLSANEETKKTAMKICFGMGLNPPDLVYLFLIDLAKKNLSKPHNIDLTKVDWSEVCASFCQK